MTVTVLHIIVYGTLYVTFIDGFFFLLSSFPLLLSFLFFSQNSLLSRFLHFLPLYVMDIFLGEYMLVYIIYGGMVFMLRLCHF